MKFKIWIFPRNVNLYGNCSMTVLLYTWWSRNKIGRRIYIEGWTIWQTTVYINKEYINKERITIYYQVDWSARRIARVCEWKVELYRKLAIVREPEHEENVWSWTFHKWISSLTRLFPNRICALCTVRFAFLRSKNRLCVSARPDGGNNEHRGHGCTRSGIQSRNSVPLFTAHEAEEDLCRM